MVIKGKPGNAAFSFKVCAHAQINITDFSINLFLSCWSKGASLCLLCLCFEMSLDWICCQDTTRRVCVSIILIYFLSIWIINDSIFNLSLPFENTIGFGVLILGIQKGITLTDLKKKRLLWLTIFFCDIWGLFLFLFSNQILLFSFIFEFPVNWYSCLFLVPQQLVFTKLTWSNLFNMLRFLLNYQKLI